MNDIFTRAQSAAGSETVRQVTDFDRALFLEQVLIDSSLNGLAKDDYYRGLRHYFLEHSSSHLLPKWIKTFKSLNAIWHFVKMRCPNYPEREAFIRAEFRPLINHLRSQPVLASEPAGIAPKSSSAAQQTWQKALAEISYNPEGAITLAIINLETTCKNILEQHALQPNTKLELYGLYQETVKALGLFSAANEVSYRALLDNLSELVSNLDLFNDELGQGSRAAPSPEEARLLVNLTGAATQFLLEMNEQQKTAAKR
jgi:hypothetical protein